MTSNSPEIIPARDFCRTPAHESWTAKSNGYCNNCGKYGHVFHQCKSPITSYGLVVFRRVPPAMDGVPSSIEYLMICRRDTLGFIDFMRGKYSVSNKEYILNMMIQMTADEKRRLLMVPFDQIWRDLWGETPTSEQYRSEEYSSREKIALLRTGVVTKDDFYTLESLIHDSNTNPAMWGSTDGLGEPWQVAEWGFPKGRRNYQEKDYECAVREFCEETGYPSTALVPIKNLLPFEEIFTGSNYKSYKHKYYLTYMSYETSLMKCVVQSSEVSRSEWKTFDGCMRDIRNYNVEKKRMLTNIDHTIREYL